MHQANVTHPSREQLGAFVAGKLGHADQAVVETHVADCDECCEFLRSLSHETLVQRMRPAETSAWPDETQTGMASETGRLHETNSALPPELADHPRYRIVKQLGAGGMGVVYQAEHRLMERPVALKVVNRQLVNNRIAIERFQLEVKAAASLDHRNIVTAYDAEQAGDLHFLVMEFVEGTSLSELVQRRGALSVLHACNFVMQAAQGLQHASEHGMVHRDIKPQNLMRTPHGTIKILDFGLARLASEIESGRLTKDGVALGTADYIAPEQVKDSHNVDIRADIYSLGCTLYYLLAGQVPYPDRTVVDKILAHMNQPANSVADGRADIPAELVGIVQRMMAKDPAERFQTPAAVVEALKPFGRPTTSRDEPAAKEANSPSPPPVAPSQPASIGAPDWPAAGQLADPFQLPFADEQTPRIPPLSPPARRRRTIQVRAPWLRYVLPIGLLALAMLAMWWLWPVFRRALDGSGDSFASTEPDIVGAPPARPPATAGGSGETSLPAGDWIDLLRGVKLSNKMAFGDWQSRDKELAVAPLVSARLVLPYETPEEYDFEVSFTRTSGKHSIALFFVAGGGQATFEIDAWGEQLAGIQNIGGQDLRDTSPRARLFQLQNDTPYTALVQVRRGHVAAYLNGELVATYQGDGTDLSVVDVWRWPSTGTLGIGAYQSATTFHCVRVRAIN